MGFTARTGVQMIARHGISPQWIAAEEGTIVYPFLFQV